MPYKVLTQIWDCGKPVLLAGTSSANNMKTMSSPSKVFIWKVIYAPEAVTWREWNVQVIWAGKVYMYIMSLYVNMARIFTWKVKWLRNPPKVNFLHVPLPPPPPHPAPFPHAFPHVSPSVSPVSLGISHVSSGVSPCVLF